MRQNLLYNELDAPEFILEWASPPKLRNAIWSVVKLALRAELKNHNSYKLLCLKDKQNYVIIFDIF